MKQRTIAREVSLKGKALHTGDEVHLTFKPAPEDHGVVFRRIDQYGKPELKPEVGQVTDVVRNTTLTSGHTKIHTVEHVLSALSGLSVNNVLVEIDAGEPPILDGSSRPFVEALLEAEPVEQGKECDAIVIDEPVSVSNGSRSIIALPYDGLKITCTSQDDRDIHTQHFSIDVDMESYQSQIAPARTFTIYEEIEELLKLGKIQGGSLDSAIVIKGDKILSKEKLRFKDEFVRHKILDIIGDISLLGKPVKAHIIAVRPGHALNASLTQAIHEKFVAKTTPKTTKKKEEVKKVTPAEEIMFDIRTILNTLPHRYPFILVDRVISMSEESLVAIKNVTINEPFFQGHFPGHPVMPGVLQVEAMAQAAGIFVFRMKNLESKVAYFMSADKVKFKRPVVPGDQLEITVKLVKFRGNKIAVATGECKVAGKVVSSAELMFTFADAED